MSYNAVPTVSTGDTWSAANHNTYIRDNFAAGVPDIFTAAGDIAYATAANAASPLAIGSAGLPLVSDGALPIWGSFAYTRQGGDATDWNTRITSSDATSSDNYTPAKSIIQVGVCQITCPSGQSAWDGSIVFPVAFSAKPIVFQVFVATTGFTGSYPHSDVSQITATDCHIYTYYSQGQVGDKANSVYWMAIGPIA